ncbi:ABC transporter six-transmembrane domain-containing protein [Allomuricauda sp. SCSIO 65647]|uniref:ABC transporter six-transmembrane domain-containing protein n=1 Tax=Allomuricauda sp. SCSIO 65647 TaxID=2908843 RepID=UPI001F40A59F|nr:ABC transporter six-transmembrane domain-containing protein [Muricauda sp. SCSIO 65647]UJH68751.1 ABC transporter six-transmembrane domain-containing protein [Muricauda sp. SCSIO 65647]
MLNGRQIVDKDRIWKGIKKRLDSERVTIRSVLLEFKWKLIFIFFLILIESAIELLIPLFIGFAIDNALDGSYTGAIQLGVLGTLIILIGGGRRFFDSRIYAKIYRRLGNATLLRIEENQSSIKTARLGMINEIIEFLENSLPALISTIIGMAGVVIIIASLNLNVFLAGLVATFLVFLIYFLTRKRTTHFNSVYNNEFEKQVDIITTNDDTLLASHLKNMMKWNIKLSDLEVFNFSMSWLVLIGFLVLSIIFSASLGNMTYGALFSLIIYVFQYIESVIALPAFYQNWLRLKEIKERLEKL